MPLKPDLSLVVPEDLGRVHFIGIGGSGMSGIAHMMSTPASRSGGSDREESPYLPPLREHGATVHVGHDAANLGDVDTVVFTSAIWPENPEYLLAQERGLTSCTARRHCIGSRAIGGCSPSPAPTARPPRPA